MSRDYGRLGSGRRSGSAIWQWMIIGGVLGFGCAAAAFLGLLLTGNVTFDPNGLNRITPTAIVQVVTSTPDLNLPTETPLIITATTEPRPTQEANVIAPSSTPPVTTEPVTTEEAAVTEETGTTDVQPLATESLDTTEDPSATQETGTTGDTGSTGTRGTDGGVPPQLEGIGSPLLPVTGGSFIMGTSPSEVQEAVRICIDDGGQCEVTFAEDAYPAHNVTLDSFSIEQYEVSLAQYVQFLNYLKSTGVDHSNGCNGNRCVETKVENPDSTNIAYDTNLYTFEPSFTETLPVTFVSWHGADAYCRALGRRLPTEAEWEFAARGPGNNIYPWGRDFLVENASTSRSVNEDGTQSGIQPVNAYPGGASPFGTFNQAGNVGEWVADWYGPYAAADAFNPTGPSAGSQKVVRGGNWAFNPFFARTMQRIYAAPDSKEPTVGFRCAADAQVPATTLGNTTTDTTGSLGNTVFETPVGTPDPANLGVIGSSTETGGAAPTLAAATPTLSGGPTQPALPPGS
jgi:formylglycine-generating enzyme required for sulfatase activity